MAPHHLVAGAQCESRSMTWTPENLIRFVKFALVGLSNTGITFAVFNVRVRWPGLPTLAASALAWIANSIIWNRAWTFADRGSLPSRRVLPRFLASNLVAL